MGNSLQFAVLNRDSARPTVDQVKRAFKVFNNLTDADAVRLTAGAHGVLKRHLTQDEARALQSAFQAEGISAVIVPEDELPKLPESRALHRLALWPQALTVYDLLGRPTAIPWPQITLVAAGAAQHFELNRAAAPPSVFRPAPRAGHNPETGHKRESGPQLILEIFAYNEAVCYYIDPAHFTFKYVLDRPGLSLEEKFVWLVRELCHLATGAILNSGARSLQQGGQKVPAYMNRQILTDELIWLLWREAQQKKGRTP